MTNSTGKNVFLRNAELNWCKLDKPVNPFGTEIYEMQAATTDKAVAKEWKELGFKIKQDDGKYIVNLKRKAKRADGSDNSAPAVFDAALNKLDPKIIGNGSTGHVKVYQYPYEWKGRKGISSSLTAVQVVNLVEYTGGGNSETEGFDIVEKDMEAMETSDATAETPFDSDEF